MILVRTVLKMSYEQVENFNPRNYALGFSPVSTFSRKEGEKELEHDLLSKEKGGNTFRVKLKTETDYVR